MNESDAQKRYPFVTPEDAREYFVDKKLSATCRACSGRSFTIAQLPSQEVPGFAVQNTNNRQLAGVVPLVLLECDDCGIISCFREIKIYEYLQKKRSSEAEGQNDD